MDGPPGWQILNEELWHLSDRDQKTFWWALARAQHWRPTTLRQQIGLVGVVRLTDDALGRLCLPAVVLATLEALVGERLLERRQCTRIEDVILTHVQANGRWQGDLEGRAVQTTWHAPDIRTLATLGQP
jgi:hypothetical protein